MQQIAVPLVMLMTLGMLASCGEQEDVEVQLLPLGSCADVEQLLRSTTLAEMNRQLDEALATTLEAGGRSCPVYYGSPDADGVNYSNAASPGTVAPTGSSAAPSEEASQVSKTNNQVAGVEEADFIKNDEKYIYAASGQHFRIIEAWPPSTMHELSRVTIEGQPRKLFVSGSRALVYSSLTSSSRTADYRECTYGYSCDFTGDGNPTLITILDVSDRRAPRKIRELRVSGSYVNARQIGSAVFTVFSAPAISFPSFSYYPDDLGCGQHGWWEIVLAFERVRARNAKLIAETRLGEALPSVRDHILEGPLAGEQHALLADCQGFYRSGMADGQQFTTVLGLDMSDDKPATASTIVSRPGAVYSSAEALYLAVPHERVTATSWFSQLEEVSQASTVHKFALDVRRASARYQASGVVKGRVLNQFAMDERDGLLRIATTTGQVPDPNVHSTMSVLGQRGRALAIVGILDELAPHEDIRSVRFDGERAFVVTFKKTDPLFVIDLSSPTSPLIRAELKIPGFSTYMHMMDSQHLLTIGYDADDQGSFAWFTGVLLQIFDVSDLSAPVLAHREVIGTRGSSSEALGNHLAFNYFAPKQVLALPMTICESSAGGGSYGTDLTFSGLLVYNVSVENGFSLRGKVAHPLAAGVTCTNWWTDPSSQVQRSIIMDDYVFSISEELVKVNSLDALATDLGSLPIGD